MREIKFRAWDKKHKQMVNLYTPTAFCEDGYDEIDYIAFSKCDVHYVDSSQVVGVEQYELMQYTGLKDKNGKEIWEGDILKHSEYGSCEVVNKFGGFGIEAKTSSWISSGFHSFSTRSADYEHCEVIGNIYEDGHLLGDRV